jgi:Transposase domain (DUF772)
LRRNLASFYSAMGRPSVDPELMIRMLIVGYCFGIRSAVLVQNMSAAFAEQLMAPNDIKATFFNGQPFNAASPSAPNSQ